MKLGMADKALLLTAVMLLAGGVMVREAAGGELQGRVLESGGSPVAGVPVLLFNVHGARQEPMARLSGEKGQFAFPLGNEKGQYCLMAYRGDDKVVKPIAYQGATELVELVVSQPWFQGKEIAGIAWNVVVYLATFGGGLFSRELLDMFSRRKTQRGIAQIYNGAITGWEEALQDAPKGKSEYEAMGAKLKAARDSLEKLLSYSWAVEKLPVEFYTQLDNRLTALNEISKNLLVKEGEDAGEVQKFIAKHFGPEESEEARWSGDLAKHKHFQKLLEGLKI